MDSLTGLRPSASHERSEVAVREPRKASSFVSSEAAQEALGLRAPGKETCPHTFDFIYITFVFSWKIRTRFQNNTKKMKSMNKVPFKIKCKLIDF